MFLQMIVKMKPNVNVTNIRKDFIEMLYTYSSFAL